LHLKAVQSAIQGGHIPRSRLSLEPNQLLRLDHLVDSLIYSIQALGDRLLLGDQGLSGV